MKKTNSIITLLVILILLAIPLPFIATQFKTPSPTMQFVKALGSPYNTIDFDFEVYGSISKSLGKDGVIDSLADIDDVHNRDELLAVIDENLKGSYSQYFDDVSNEYINFPESWAGVCHELTMLSGADAGERLNRVMEIYARNPSCNPVRVMELSSASFFASLGYVSEYLTFEEAAKYSVDAAKELQTICTSWQQFQENFLLAMDFCNIDNADVFTEDHEFFSEHLKTVAASKTELFKTPFDTELKLEDMKASYAPSADKSKRIPSAIVLYVIAELVLFAIILPIYFKISATLAYSKKPENFEENGPDVK